MGRRGLLPARSVDQGLTADSRNMCLDTMADWLEPMNVTDGVLTTSALPASASASGTIALTTAAPGPRPTTQSGPNGHAERHQNNSPRTAG